MGSANYLHNETIEINRQKKAIASLPELPMGVLEKVLPKALKQLSTGNCTRINSEKCDPHLVSLIEPLLVGTNGQFYYMKDRAERERVRQALEYFVKIKAFKLLKEYNSTICAILKMNLFWIRDISTLEFKSKNTYKQLKTLLEHVFCEYEVPEFMFQSWTEKNSPSLHLDWFLHLAGGGSAKQLHKYPIAATKKMLHEFITTPFPGYSISDAVRRSQVLGLGGDERLANAILMSRLRNEFSNNDFWTTVIQFFVGIPMLNLDEVGTIIDYINEQKFVPTRVIVNGIATYRAENPNFSMKGRNLENLIRDTHAWHRQLAQLRRQAGGNTGTSTSYKPDLTSKWTRTHVKPFNVTEGKKEKQKIWSITEITNAAELYDEGKSMRHCVYSYLKSCIDGKCSIFSLRLFGTSVATIEVRGTMAVQIRGPRNQRPTEKELSLINDWAKKELIEITKYAVTGR